VLAREKKEGGVGERENRLRDKDGRERVAKKISRPDGGCFRTDSYTTCVGFYLEPTPII
jgi:hypothetical protein